MVSVGEATTRGARRRGWSAIALIGLLAACHHRDRDVAALPAPQPSPSASPTPTGPQATPGRSPEERYAAAVSLLNQGNTAQARVELTALLAQRPGDRHATTLLRTVDADAHALFGSESFPYAVQAGDTLPGLAHRFLHDAANFYGLGRYNGLTFPVELHPGQTLQIPGRAKPVARPPATPRHPTPQPSATPTRPVEPSRPAGPSAAERSRAQQLRQEGLEQMSAGSIDRAVQLLSQAATLDPGNGAIGSELARARRIQATVHSR